MRAAHCSGALLPETRVVTRRKRGGRPTSRPPVCTVWCGFAHCECASGATRASTGSLAASERHPMGASGTGRRVGVGAERRRQGGSGGRSRRWRERGKAAGVATGEPATGSDPGEWSCSDDESPEAAVSAEPSRLRPKRVTGAAVGAEHRSGGRSRSCYPSRPWPESRKIDRPEVSPEAAGPLGKRLRRFRRSQRVSMN